MLMVSVPILSEKIRQKFRSSGHIGLGLPVPVVSVSTLSLSWSCYLISCFVHQTQTMPLDVLAHVTVIVMEKV